MNQNKDYDYPDWFLWMYAKGPVLFLIGGAILMMVVVSVTLYLDHRVGQVEDRLQYVPPRSYQPVNLEDFAVGDFEVETLPVRQVVYVPVYSHVYYQGGSPYQLETTLSIRNTDLDQAIYLNSVDYFDTSGKLVKTYLDRPIRLRPLQTIEFLVERRDSSGGSGANFLVAWLSELQVDKPLVEAIMVGTAGTQGICFARTGIQISGGKGGSDTEQ